MPNSKQKGEETEARLVHELISSGHSVSTPFGDNEECDIVVDDGTDLHQVQCKTGWETEKGTVRFDTHSQTTRAGEYYASTYHGEIDAFLVWFPPTESLFWIDIKEATSQKMELRFDADIDHPSINWAGDYEFDGTIPEG
jgi:hypothetical protein